MAVRVRFRDALRKFVPVWLSDRRQDNKTVGFRFLWSMIAVLDMGADLLVEGLQAPWPGKGTPTALDLIARSRGLIRGESETDAAFAERLRGWLDRWRAAGSADAIARAIHEYVAGHPRVRIVTRGGYWVTLETEGSITRQQGTWDWDSVSHPERANLWAEIWIIVYPSPYAHRPEQFGDAGLVFGGDPLGIGHQVTRQSYDAIKSLVEQWKAAHTRVRAVIWTTDGTLFDPDTPASLPDGTWGAWGTTGNSSRVASGRNLTTCRYWEP